MPTTVVPRDYHGAEKFLLLSERHGHSCHGHKFVTHVCVTMLEHTNLLCCRLHKSRAVCTT